MTMTTLGGVPVLMYHALVETPRTGRAPFDRRYALSATAFRDHLTLIRQGGHRTVVLADLWPPSPPAPAPRSVVVTFDDGRASDYDLAYPRLLDAGHRAEFFINTATVGRRGFLDWARIAEMQHGGMSFQSHSHDHVALSFLSRPLLRLQLRDSKRMLEDRLGCRVDFVAVPYGLVNRAVIEVAREEGYRAVCTSRAWPARPGASTVNRVAVEAGTTPGDLRGLLEGHLPPYARRVIRAALISLPRRLVLRLRPETLGVRVLERPA